MSQPATVASESVRDQQLAVLLNELTERRRQGRSVDLQALAREHPDLSDELSGLWSAVLLAEFGRPKTTPSGPGPALGPGLQTTPHHKETTPGEPQGGAEPLPRFFGAYELLEELGRGGMGVVYKARQRNPERIVALKMALRGELASAEERARFTAEAKMAARLNDARIVQVYDVGEHDGQVYFSMQFIEGTTLARLVSDGPLPPREAARHVAAIARAVQHAHDQGVVHRDLKPSNVLLSKRGQAPFSGPASPAESKTVPVPSSDYQPYVTDFGLARRVEGGESLTRTGAIVGTPSYMAPEQAEGKRGTPASDIYSLGAILYHLLTGKPPFQAASLLDTLLLVREQDLVPPRQLNPRVDRDLEWICLKCLEKRPEDRYRSAGELANHLEAFLQGETPPVWPSNMAYFVSRMMRQTHHAPILENWGALWMWHSLQVMFQCGLTAILAWRGVDSRWPYLLIWGVGLLIWAGIFWALRRRAGPVMFIERQIAHVWGAAIFASISVFFVEILLGMPVLSLSPILAVIAGIVFMVKAGMLSGEFYFAALASFLAAVPMALLMKADRAPLAILLFGVVTAGSFFIHGLKYHHQRARSARPGH
jgi:serine/threonine-protein kinase